MSHFEVAGLVVEAGQDLEAKEFFKNADYMNSDYRGYEFTKDIQQFRANMISYYNDFKNLETMDLVKVYELLTKLKDEHKGLIHFARVEHDKRPLIPQELDHLINEVNKKFEQLHQTQLQEEMTKLKTMTFEEANSLLTKLIERKHNLLEYKQKYLYYNYQQIYPYSWIF